MAPHKGVKHSFGARSCILHYRKPAHALKQNKKLNKLNESWIIDLEYYLKKIYSSTLDEQRIKLLLERCLIHFLNDHVLLNNHKSQIHQPPTTKTASDLAEHLKVSNPPQHNKPNISQHYHVIHFKTNKIHSTCS